MEALPGQAGKSAPWVLVHGRPGILLWSSTGISLMMERNKWHINEVNEVNDENLSSFLASSCPAVWLSTSCQFPPGEGGHLRRARSDPCPEQGSGSRGSRQEGRCPSPSAWPSGAAERHFCKQVPWRVPNQQDFGLGHGHVLEQALASWFLC